MTKEIRDGFFEVTFKLRLESELSMQQKDIGTFKRPYTYIHTTFLPTTQLTKSGYPERQHPGHK